MDYDTIIVGGGPAGLSAALVLGRCRRRVLVLDAGRPRNHASERVGGFFTRDGTPPARLLGIGRKELTRYGVEFRKATVRHAECTDEGFTVTVGRSRPTARTLLLATGVLDELPDVPGARDFYGTGVHHCPYCDGWEYRDKPLAAFGDGKQAVGLALNLLTWSESVTAVTGGATLTRADRRRAERHGVAVREEPIRRLTGVARKDGRPVLRRIEFESGPDLNARALFFNTAQFQRSGLPGVLGCALDEHGGVVRDRRQRTGVHGLFLAGDASKDVQFVAVAAAEGARAAVGINSMLQKLDLAERARRGSPA